MEKERYDIYHCGGEHDGEFICSIYRYAEATNWAREHDDSPEDGVMVYDRKGDPVFDW